MGQVETNPDLALENDLVEATSADFSTLTYILVGTLGLLVGGLAGVAIIQLSGGWPRFWPLSALIGGLITLGEVYAMRRRATFSFWKQQGINLILSIVIVFAVYGGQVLRNEPATNFVRLLIEGMGLYVAGLFSALALRSPDQDPAITDRANKPGTLIVDSAVYGLLACIPVATFGFAPRLATALPFIVIIGAVFLLPLGMVIARIRRAVLANQPASVAFYAAAAFMVPVFAAVAFAVLRITGAR